jgi:hypothetical protein
LQEILKESRMFAIKQLLRGFASPAERAMMVAEDLGLAVDKLCPNRQAEDAYLAKTLDECDADVTRMLHREYDEKFATLGTLPGGRRMYSVLESAVTEIADTTDAPEVCEQMLDIFEEDWEANHRSPFASAFYAMLLSNTSFAWRGDAGEDNLIDPRWVKYQKYHKLARNVFLENAPKADQCPFWHRMYYAFGSVDGSRPKELQARFERAIAFDPGDADICATRMQQLLPGNGGSYADMDAFAQQCVAATRSEMGTAIYARLYSHISCWERLALTQVNYNMLRNSFFDWQRKNKSQFVINAMVSAAAEFQDFDTINGMLGREWTEFHPDAWASNERAVEAMTQLEKRRKTPKAQAA